MELKRTLDKEIMWVVKELNKKGYSTKYSCAGHNNDKYGYVMFKNNLKIVDRSDVEQILHKHGLRKIIFSASRKELVKFDRVGR